MPGSPPSSRRTASSRHLLQQPEPLRVAHRAERVDLALLHDEVRVALAEPGSLQQAHDLVLGRAFALEEELVLLVPDGPPEDHLVGVLQGEPVVGVVEHDLHEGVHGGGPASLVEEGLALLLKDCEGRGGGEGVEQGKDGHE